MKYSRFRNTATVLQSRARGLVCVLVIAVVVSSGFASMARAHRERALTGAAVGAAAGALGGAVAGVGAGIGGVALGTSLAYGFWHACKLRP